MDAQEHRIVMLLLEVDCDATIPWDRKFDAFAQRTKPEDRDHPLVKWIMRINHRLDWRDNVREFLIDVLDLPAQGFLPSEPAVTEYETAARTRLAQERLAVHD